MIRELRADDWPAVRTIYAQGIRGGNATFETELPSWERWDAAHPDLRLVAERDGAVVGPHKVWVEIRPSSPKEEADLRSGQIKLNSEMNAILQKYGKDSTPLQKVAVKEEDPQVIDLKLD